MQAALPLRDGQIEDLIRRAETGEEVVLTKDGLPRVRLVLVAAPRPKRSFEEKMAILDEISRRGAAKFPEHFDAARSQDFLYDEFGLPV